MPEHVHMLISIPPKYSVSQIIGFLKGKTAIYVADKYARKRRYKGYHFWARGYLVSTTGYNEQVVRRYIRSKTASSGSSAAFQTFTFGGGHDLCFGLALEQNPQPCRCFTRPAA